MAQDLFRQGMFICGTKFITIRLKNWQKMRRYSCTKVMYGNSPKYSQSRRNETKNSDNSMNNKIRLYLPKTIEAYPGFASNFGSRYLQFIA